MMRKAIGRDTMTIAPIPVTCFTGFLGRSVRIDPPQLD